MISQSVEAIQQAQEFKLNEITLPHIICSTMIRYILFQAI